MKLCFNNIDNSPTLTRRRLFMNFICKNSNKLINKENKMYQGYEYTHYMALSIKWRPPANQTLANRDSNTSAPTLNSSEVGPPTKFIIKSKNNSSKNFKNKQLIFLKLHLFISIFFNFFVNKLKKW